MQYNVGIDTLLRMSAGIILLGQRAKQRLPGLRPAGYAQLQREVLI